MQKKNYLSKTEAAYKILKEIKKPLHVEDIIEIALKRNLIETKGKTPAATLKSDFLFENRRKLKRGQKLRFFKMKPKSGVWGLSKWKKKRNTN